MITVHHLNNSRSQRVLWLLEELALPYEIVAYQRHAATLLAPAELLAIHPLGKSPILTDDGLVVAESGAIIEYLLDRYGEGRLRPAAGTPERLRYNYFLHYAEGSAMPLLLLKLVTVRLARPPVPALLRPWARLIAAGLARQLVDPQLARHQAFLEAELAKFPWFAGTEFSAADIQMSFVLEGFVARARTASGTPLQELLGRMHARPAYQRAQDRGGPFHLG